MKRSGTVLIFVIVWAAVLFTSFVIGIGVREIRFHRARGVVEGKQVTETPAPKVTSKIEKLSDAEKLAQELAQKAPASGAGGGERLANRPPRPEGEGGMENMRERFANMSDEERAQMRERGGRRRGGGQNISEEQRAEMEERRRQMMERMESMSEEERQAMRAQMRERGGRRQGGGEGGRSRPGGGQNREQQENN